MKDWTAADRRQRARLERNSNAGTRADVCGILNKVAAGDASRALPGLEAYALLMAAQTHGRHVAKLNDKHDRMLNTGRLEGERLDRLHPESPLRRATGGIVADSGGSITAVDARTRANHWSDGSVSPAEEVLSVEDLRHIAAQKWRNRFF